MPNICCAWDFVTIILFYLRELRFFSQRKDHSAPPSGRSTAWRAQRLPLVKPPPLLLQDLGIYHIEMKGTTAVSSLPWSQEWELGPGLMALSHRPLLSPSIALAL